MTTTTRSDSTNSTAGQECLTIDFKALTPKKHRMFLIFEEAELRPPVYEEMQKDMEHVIYTSVANYEDRSCVEMHLDNLISECWCKVTEMSTKGAFDRCKNRMEYFALFKTGIMNHIYSHIQKYRFTEKRTGHAPPPKDKRKECYTTEDFASTKPNEVRIDDPDSGFQIADMESGCESKHFNELVEEIKIKLNPAESIVFEQMLSPNDRSMFYALYDAERGRQPGSPLKIAVRNEHLIKGLDECFPPAYFNQLKKSIQAKCEFMKTHIEDDPKKMAAMATLIQFFGVQIPASIPESIKTRMLMVATCNQFDRVCENEGIKSALATCEVPLPVKRGNKLSCFGIMYLKGFRTCQSCGQHDACAQQACNVGLDMVTLNHGLLDHKFMRIPVITPSRHKADSAFAASSRDEEILNFLGETLSMIDSNGEIMYRHKDNLNLKGNQSILSLGKQINPFMLRFINPSPEICDSLEYRSTGNAGRPAYYLPDDMDAEEAMNVIRAHAEVTFKQGA